MKTAALIVAFAALSASAAVSAHEGASLTQVQIVAQRNTAFAAGDSPYGERYAGTRFETVSTKTREQVKAEVLIARQRGELVDGEQYPLPVASTGKQGKTRAEVRAELTAYRVANPDTYSLYN
jgi:hypothetical protein